MNDLKTSVNKDKFQSNNVNYSTSLVMREITTKTMRPISHTLG